MLAHLPDLIGAMVSNLLILVGLTYLVSLLAGGVSAGAHRLSRGGLWA